MLSLSLPNLSLGCFPIPLIDISSLPRLKRKSLWSTVPKALISASEERGTHTTADITRVFLMADKTSRAAADRTLPPMVPISDTSQHRWSFAKCVSPKIEFNLFPDSTSSDSVCWCRHRNIIELTVFLPLKVTINDLPLLCLFVLIQYFWKSSRFMMKKNWWEQRRRPKPIRRVTKVCSTDDHRHHLSFPSVTCEAESLEFDTFT